MSPKRPERNWELRVEDILQCIVKIEQYIAGMTFESFTSDTKTQDAVIHNLAVIGEAANHIPADIQDQYPEIAWVEMRGFRNIMIHEYFGVSLQIIWRTASQDLLLLSKQMEQTLDNLR